MPVVSANITLSDAIDDKKPQSSSCEGHNGCGKPLRERSTGGIRSRLHGELLDVDFPAHQEYTVSSEGDMNEPDQQPSKTSLSHANTAEDVGVF